MKKVILYTDTPQVGGAELQMFLLAKFLDKEKFTPILVCSNFSALDKWCENFEKENIKVVRLKVKSKHDLKHYFGLKKAIKENAADLLHLHIWNPASCRYAFMVAKSTKIPTIITEHDPFQLSYLKTVLKNRFLKSTSKIVAVSEDNAKLLKKLYPMQKSKVDFIHNGIDINWWQSQLLRFTEEDEHEIKVHLFGGKIDDVFVTTIAELHERKGINFLIDAFAKIAPKFPSAKLIIVGGGGEKEALEKQIEHLKLPGRAALLGKQKEIPKILKCSNVFVLPSRREAFGYVLLEAMVTHLPIVASRAGGIPEVIEDKTTGLLAEPENAESISKALSSLLKSPEKRLQMGENGFKRVSTKFSAKVMAEGYEKLYEKISS